VVELLLRRGADVNKRDDDPRDRPLRWAARQGHADVAKRLVAAGAMVNLDSGYGTALHNAAEWGKADVVRMLLKLGTDRTLKTGDGKTALELAAAGKHNAVVALLNEDKCAVM
jgi:ankyrin repeat protein